MMDEKNVDKTQQKEHAVSQPNRKRKHLWTVGLSLSAIGLLGVIILQPYNWADSPMLSSSNEAASTAPMYTTTILDADLIRVGISNDAMTELEYPSATLSATGRFQVTNKATGQLVFEGQPNQPIRMSRNNSGFWLDTSNLSGRIGPFNSDLQIKPLSSDDQLKILSVTRKGIIPTYRGLFEITPGYSGPDKFTVVNVLPMQDYLKAVVPNELPYSYGYEAVKAQAVAARNYAIHPREKPWPQFDICDSQYCQAYYGANTEHPQTTRAILETQGLIALYHGEPILALYSSSHGGYSENYENAFSDPKTNRFPATPIPYLRGGPDRGGPRDLSTEKAARAFYSDTGADSYDVLSPNYRWQKLWGRQELEAMINQNLAAASKDTLTRAFVKPAFPAGGRIGTLKALNVSRRGVSGKVMRLEIEGSNGAWTLDKEFVIRRVLKHNGRFLPSANVVFNHLRDKNGALLAVKAIGGGFGHGVGMSQLGASYLSKHGKPFTEILQHYYKGIAIGTIPIMAKGNQGMKTEFFVSSPKGMLYIQSADKDPVRLAINNQDLTVSPDETGRAVTSVVSYLKPETLNELKLYPSKNPSNTVKAWIELYTAKDKPEQVGSEKG